MKALLIPIVMLSFTTLSLPAYADLQSMKARVPTIVALKDKGLVGEKPDGLLGLVKEDPKTKEIVDAENADRMEVYQKRAQAQGHAIDVFMKVMGEGFLKKEKAGRFIQNEDGTWTKKK